MRWRRSSKAPGGGLDCGRDGRFRATGTAGDRQSLGHKISARIRAPAMWVADLSKGPVAILRILIAERGDHSATIIGAVGERAASRTTTSGPPGASPGRFPWAKIPGHPAWQGPGSRPARPRGSTPGGTRICELWFTFGREGTRASDPPHNQECTVLWHSACDTRHRTPPIASSIRPADAHVNEQASLSRRWGVKGTARIHHATSGARAARSRRMPPPPIPKSGCAASDWARRLGSPTWATALMENRHGPVVNTPAIRAHGTAEPTAAVDMLADRSERSRRTSISTRARLGWTCASLV